MADCSVQNSENHSDELKVEYENVLAMYLPFIEEMQAKSEGTSIEVKWKLMRESLVNPKKELTLEMLQNVRQMLDDLKVKEESKNESSHAPDSEEHQSQPNANDVQSEPKAAAIDTSARRDSSNDHSYAKFAPDETKEDSSKAEAPRSTFNTILHNTVKSSADKEEKSSNVKKLTIHDLFRNSDPSDDFNFDVSDSEYPELERDEDDDQQELDTNETVIEKNPKDKLEEQDLEVSPEPTDMELDEELMEMNRTIVNEERTPDGTDLDTKTISTEHAEPASQSSTNGDSSSVDNVGTKLSPMRKGHQAITDALIKEVILLKEQLINEKRNKREVASSSTGSQGNDSEESLMEEVKKRSTAKIKLPSAKKRRVEPKATSIKKEKDCDGFKGFDRSEVEDLNDITIIPYQCSILSPSVVRSPQWTNNDVANISFMKLKRGFMVKCNVTGCRFQSLVKETLKEHLETKHRDQEWNGFCNICEKSVGPKKASVREEFAHMEIHIASLKPGADGNQSNSFKILTSTFDDPQNSSVFMSPSSLPDTSCEPTKSALESHLTAISTPPVAQKPPKKVIRRKKPALAVFKPPAHIYTPFSSVYTSATIYKPGPAVYTPHPSDYTPSPAGETSESTSILSKLLSSSTFVPNNGDQFLKPSNCLRPWVQAKLHKNPEQARAILQSKEALVATYKCMSSTCSFFTIDRELFMKHLTFHEKFTAGDKTNFLTCSYCDVVTTKPVHLADHVDNEHAHDQFQCNYCFYRACTVYSVTTHQSMFHLTQPNVIIECDLIRPRDTRAHLEKVAKLRAEFVPPIICVFCYGKFFVMQAFKEHLRNNHSDADQLAQCIKCGRKAKCNQVRGHVEVCLGMGSFQCVYCNFGTENFDKLNNHIVNNHASKIPVYCERVWNKNPDGTHKYASPSVVEATCIKNIKPNFQNHCKKELRKAPKDQVLLRNEDNVGFLKPNLVIHKTNERKSSEPPSILSSLLQATKQAKTPSKVVGSAAQTVKVTSQTFKAACQTVKASSQANKPVKIQAGTRMKIVAQMPRETLTPSQEISSLLKPLFKEA